MFAKFKFFMEQSWLLMTSSVIFGCLLACLNAAWAPRIEENQRQKFNTQAKLILSAAETFEAVPNQIQIDMGKGKLKSVEVKKALDAAGQLVGWAFMAEGAGFADKIQLVVTTDAGFEKMVGFRVLSSNETPGFGDKINITPEEKGFFQPQFVGIPAGKLILEKTGDPSVIDDTIVAISGATVSSQAVVDTLNAWVLPIKEKLKAEGLLK